MLNYQSSLMIRNNLTKVEHILLKGYGITAQLDFGIYISDIKKVKGFLIYYDHNLIANERQIIKILNKHHRTSALNKTTTEALNSNVAADGTVFTSGTSGTTSKHNFRHNFFNSTGETETTNSYQAKYNFFHLNNIEINMSKHLYRIGIFSIGQKSYEYITEDLIFNLDNAMTTSPFILSNHGNLKIKILANKFKYL